MLRQPFNKRQNTWSHQRRSQPQPRDTPVRPDPTSNRQHPPLNPHTQTQTGIHVHSDTAARQGSSVVTSYNALPTPLAVTCVILQQPCRWVHLHWHTHNCGKRRPKGGASMCFTRKYAFASMCLHVASSCAHMHRTASVCDKCCPTFRDATALQS